MRHVKINSGVMLAALVFHNDGEPGRRFSKGVGDGECRYRARQVCLLRLQPAFGRLPVLRVQG